MGNSKSSEHIRLEENHQSEGYNAISSKTRTTKTNPLLNEETDTGELQYKVLDEETDTDELQYNWDRFILSTQSRSQCHMIEAQYWDRVDTRCQLAIILLAGVTTFLALIPQIPSLVVAGIAGLSTMISAGLGFVKPGEKRQWNYQASRDYQLLTHKISQCRNVDLYRELWTEYNKIVIDAPFLKGPISRDNTIMWEVPRELHEKLLEGVSTSEAGVQMPEHDENVDA